MNQFVRILMVGLLVFAVLGYTDFGILRLFIFIGVIYLIVDLVKNHAESGAEALYLYGYVGIAILFNPILPVYLYIRDRWIIIDLLVIVFLLLQDRFISKSKEDNHKQKTFSEVYDSLSPDQKRKYLDDVTAFDDWSTNNSYLFYEDEDEMLNDAINDALLEYGCEYKASIGKNPEDDYKSDMIEYIVDGPTWELLINRRLSKNSPVIDKELGLGTIVSLDPYGDHSRKISVIFNSGEKRTFTSAEFLERFDR